ncbi:response regulator [Pseudomonas putida]|uniref:response regulator n=1 Tax=Pseudomonas putida TaxID=303 RepID=UPI003D9946D0
MSNKSLRILIADEQHFNRLRIERWFNQLDYYRIAPVQSLDELLAWVDYASEPFDLLVINAAFTGNRLNLLDYCLDHHQLNRVLIYDGQQARLPLIPACEQKKVQVSHAVLPDLASLRQQMALVDRHLPLVGTVISIR